MKALVSIPTKRRWWMAVVLLAAAACQGGVDTDRGRTPDEPPPPPEVPVGAASIRTDQDVIPADGTSLVTARATLTDARGIARVGAPMTFFADLPDVTWVTATADDTGTIDAFPTQCLAFTGLDGEAECVLRSGFTPGKSFVNVAGPAELGLGAATEVEFTFAEAAAGVTIEEVSCPATISSGDLPTQAQIVVRATKPGPGGTTIAAEDIRVYYTATAGKWDKTNGNRTSDVTDNTGVSDQFLNLSPEDDGEDVNVIVTAAGALPQFCSSPIAVGSFAEDTVFEIAIQPITIFPDGTEQKFTISVRLADKVDGQEVAPKIDHRITFATPAGVIEPSKLVIRGGRTGTGTAVLTLPGSVTGALLPDAVLTVLAVDEVSRKQTTFDLTVTPEDLTIEVVPLDIEFTGPGPVNVFVDNIQARVTTALGSVAGRSVTFNFGDGSVNKTAITDATGTATVTHTYVNVVDGTSYEITATDLTSNQSAQGDITFAEAAGP